MAHPIPSIAPLYESLGWVLTGFPKRVSAKALRAEAKRLHLDLIRFVKGSRLFSFEGLTEQVEAMESFAFDYHMEHKTETKGGSLC